MSVDLDLLGHLALLDATETAEEWGHGVATSGPIDRWAADGGIERVWLCECGQTIPDRAWSLHLTTYPDPRPIPTTVLGTTTALGEQGRALWTELAQQVGACIACGHARIHHGIHVDVHKESGLNGDCTRCGCNTYRGDPMQYELTTIREIQARRRRERGAA